MLKFKSPFLRGYLLSLLAAIITYTFYVLIVNHEEKYFTVPLEVLYPTQLAGSTEIEPTVNVTLRGNPSQLEKVHQENIEAILDLQSVTTPGRSTELVTLKRTGAFADIDSIEVTIDPSQITVTLEPRIVREVKIDPSFINSLPKGYLFTDYSISPSRIAVSGPDSIVTTLASIPTEEIDLSVVTYSLSQVKLLKLPNFIELESLPSKEVRVSLVIDEVMLLNTYESLTIGINNLPNRMQIDNNLPRATLVIQGPQLVFNEFTPEIYIDVASMDTVGTYTFEVNTNLPKELEIVSLIPDTVSVSSILVEDTESQNTQEQELPYTTPQSNPSPNLVPPVDQEEEPDNVPPQEPLFSPN